MTYYVRRVNEVYATSHARGRHRVAARRRPVALDFDDLDGVPDGVRKLLEQIRKALPRPGDKREDSRQITLPTDGTLYEAELAHCSSCEPTREAEELIRLERMRLAVRRDCLQTELLALELERRRSLAASAQPATLELGAFPLLAAGPAAPIAP